MFDKQYVCNHKFMLTLMQAHYDEKDKNKVMKVKKIKHIIVEPMEELDSDADGKYHFKLEVFESCSFKRGPVKE